MCEGDEACGPCKTAGEARSLAVVQQAADPKQEIAIWGPMSVETPSRDKKLIRLAAVERALPSFLRRGRFSLMHGDNNVGEASPLLKIDQARLPNDAKVRVMVNEVTAKYGGLPTGIIPVTQAIADVFPRLRKFVGKPAAFTGGPVFEDDRIGQTLKKDILQGKVDSFSIAGASFKKRPINWCDETGCELVDEIEDLDLSMVTLCSSQGQRSAFGQAQAQNPGAAFVVIQQAGEVLMQSDYCTVCEQPKHECNCESKFEQASCDCGTVSTMHIKDNCRLGLSGPIEKVSQAEATSKVPLQWRGLPLVVENVKGSTRKGIGRDGLPWERQMLAHYGHIKRTEGNDGDEVDFYLGDNLASDYVLVINQLKDDHTLDEHKCILGCSDLDAAQALYKAHYPSDFVCGPAKSMTVADFKNWLKNGDLTKMVQAQAGSGYQIVTFDQEAVGEAEGAYTTGTPGLTNPTFGSRVCDHKDCDGKCCQKVAQADSTAGGVKIDTSNGGTGGQMMTNSVTQAASGVAGPVVTVVPVPPPSPVVQAEVKTAGPPGQKAKVMEPALHGEDPLQLDMMRRLENVEQQVALLKGQRTESPAKEDQPMPETEPPKMDEKKEPPMEEKKDEKEAVYQASPESKNFDMAAAIKQAVADALPAALTAALKDFQPIKQAGEVPPSEKPKPAAEPVQQAKNKTLIETPIPAAPTPLSQANPEVERLSQALDSKGVNGFREVLKFAYQPKE